MTSPIKPAEADLVRDELVIVALGGNDKGVGTSCIGVMFSALRELESRGIQVVARSSWWQSSAWPDPTDPPFVNAVVLVRTGLSAKALIAELHGIEAALGRVRTVPNAPRTLDLDLIAYGRLVGDFDGLHLPHPRAADRLFVMGPLAEIAPDWVDPVSGRTAKVLAQRAQVGRDAQPISESA